MRLNDCTERLVAPSRMRNIAHLTKWKTHLFRILHDRNPKDGRLKRSPAVDANTDLLTTGKVVHVRIEGKCSQKKLNWRLMNTFSHTVFHKCKRVTSLTELRVNKMIRSATASTDLKNNTHGPLCTYNYTELNHIILLLFNSF